VGEALFWDDFAALVDGELICKAHGSNNDAGELRDSTGWERQLPHMRHLIVEDLDDTRFGSFG
jgi:hypothetical protein